ncbi:LysR family transcriptional regulator [Nocardia sp. CA2R105]|uniref:LysR family transcriptional regulator n=1 Tax=Nocardia coffeae TaxID=2873381 RepID=UPI001CA792D7|nr:LysR family transcriptional regulator [Nocardia coffeae]MBY8860091.1 LysR family transcriptional regulator [Nocardia coffeae]
MNLERLRILREFAEYGTLTAVAEAMAMTPSAVSQQMRTLRREAGVTLLERDGRGVRLTDAGRALAGHADRVLGALDRARADMDSYRAAPRGAVRISLFPSGAAMLLPGLLQGAQSAGFDIVGRDVDRPAAHAAQQLADFDVVVVHRDDRDNSGWSDRLDATILLREPLDVMLAPGHHLAQRRTVALAELSDERWIGVEGGLMVDDVLRSMSTITGTIPRIAQRINDFRVVEELVLTGAGIALMPRYVAITRDLIRIPISDIRIARRIEAVTRAGAAAQPSIAATLEILRTICRQIATDQPATNRR